MIYEILNRFFRKHKIKRFYMILFSVVLLTIGEIFTETSQFGMYLNILTVPLLLEIGRVIKEKNLVKKYVSQKHYIAYSVICGVALCLLSQWGNISMNTNTLVNPVYFIVCSILGFFMTLGMSNILLCIMKSIGNKVIYLGRCSLMIMMLHFISFKIVTLIQILLFSDSIDVLAEYPVYISGRGWWIVYSIVGVSVPIIVFSIYKLIVKGIKNVYKSKKSTYCLEKSDEG